MQTFLAYFDIGIVINVAIFVVTLLFSQKIKDFFAGVPSHTRAAIGNIEAALLAKVKSYEDEVVATIIPPPPKPPVPVPAAPPAAAPAAPAAPPAAAPAA